MKRFTLLALSATLFAIAVPTKDAVATGTGSPAADKAPATVSGEGKKLFTSSTTPTCAACHALRDAGATGAIGPDLDVLKPDAARVKNAVQKGFENMPAFGHVLSAAQIDALARYVEQATAR